MGLRDTLARWIGGSGYNNQVEFSDDLLLALQNGGRMSATGQNITWQTALRVSTVLRCSAIIAEGICSIPWKLYRKDGERKVEAIDHPLWDLIKYRPNEWQTSFEFRETIGFHLALCGNAYIWLNRVGKKIVEMVPFEPNMVSVYRHTDWTLTYYLSFPDGSKFQLPQEDVWHIKSHSWNSYKGLDVLSLARDSIGLSLAIEEGQAKLQKEGVRPSGILTVDQVLDAEQFKKFRKLVDTQYAGRVNAGKPMILDKTTTWEQTALSSVDSQTIETRGFQVEDVARQMGVLPIMLGHSGDKSVTYASSEQMFIAHHIFTTRVWQRRITESADVHLLTKAERKAGFYNGFVDTELLRGDTQARGEFYKLLWMIGAVTGNEIRRMEDWDDIDGLDRPWAPLNAAPIGVDGMPMVSDSQAAAGNAVLSLLRGLDPANLPTADELPKMIAQAFVKSSPMAQQMLLAHLRDMGPSEAD